MPQKPNIIFILMDDMGYGDLGIYNKGQSYTPHLDELVSKSLCLSQHYSASPVCAPARAALLTGRYPHRTGAIDTFEGRGLDRIALREKTLADFLKEAGYKTGLVGKWHSGALDPDYHPNARGFDEFIGFQGGWQDYYDWRLDYNSHYQKSDGSYLTDVFTDEAISFCERHRNEPFFLQLSYNAPHFPLQAPEKIVERYLEKSFTLGVSLIYAMLEVVDTGIGRLLESLKNTAQLDNTLIIFSSDNGPDFGGEGDMALRRFNCHFNGHKGNVYEGGIRVPLTLYWPDGVETAASSHAMTHFCDWLPTLLSITGQPIPKNLDGINLLPLLRGQDLDLNPRRFWQWNRYTPTIHSNAAMRDGPWKLVQPQMPAAHDVPPEDLAFDIALKYRPELFTRLSTLPEPERDLGAIPKTQLFNLDNDPSETTDLADSHPQKLAAMQTELYSWFETVENERLGL